MHLLNYVWIEGSECGFGIHSSRSVDMNLKFINIIHSKSVDPNTTLSCTHEYVIHIISQAWVHILF